MGLFFKKMDFFKTLFQTSSSNYIFGAPMKTNVLAKLTRQFSVCPVSLIFLIKGFGKS